MFTEESVQKAFEDLKPKKKARESVEETFYLIRQYKGRINREITILGSANSLEEAEEKLRVILGEDQEKKEIEKETEKGKESKRSARINTPFIEKITIGHERAGRDGVRWERIERIER